MASVTNSKEFLEMKQLVKDTYPTEAWAWRVEHMKVNQIIAIAKSIEKRKKKKGDGQLSLFELYPELMGGKV